MIREIEKILIGLNNGSYVPDNIFEFENIDPFDQEQSSSQEVLFNIVGTNYWISSNINWCCVIKKGMKGDYLTPNDPDDIILSDIEIENFIFGNGEEENKINIRKYPKIEKLFISYLKSLWNEQINENNNHEGIKKYRDFLFEYEGGPPTKDSIKVKSSMITELDLGEEEEEEDKDIPILKDLNNEK